MFWVVELTVNPSTYVELPTFCISEWLAVFNIIISSYFIVSFHEVLQTVTQNWCKMCSDIKCYVGYEHNVVHVIRFSGMNNPLGFFSFTFSRWWINII
jgi:hypothetical protein